MAGDLKSVGYSGLTFGPIKIDYGPKGTTTHFTVTCPTIGPLVAYYNYIIQFGAAGTFLGTDRGVDGVTSAEVKTLEVSFPGLPAGYGGLTELFFDSWELLTNEATDSIFNNPIIVGTAGWMTANDKAVLSCCATKGYTISQAVAYCNALCNATPQTLPYPATGGTGATPSQYQAPSDARSVQLYLEILKGQVEFQRPTYVLRHTSYCSANSLYNTSTANVMKIYSPAQLLTEVGTGWTYNLPPRLYSKISGIPFQYAPATEATYYTWGWLKKITREPVMSNFMVEINTEYELGLWSNLRYAHL